MAVITGCHICCTTIVALVHAHWLHRAVQYSWCARLVPLGSTEAPGVVVSLYGLRRSPKRTLALTLCTFPLPASTVSNLSWAEWMLQCWVWIRLLPVIHTSQLLLLQSALSENTRVRAESCTATSVKPGASKGSEKGRNVLWYLDTDVVQYSTKLLDAVKGY